MDRLPAEILLSIISYLEGKDVVIIRAVSRKLRKVSQDNELWKSICYDRAVIGMAHLRLDQAHSSSSFIRSQAAAALSVTEISASSNEYGNSQKTEESLKPSAERARAMANWDPSYSNESIDWYSEYVSRYGPISLSWTQPAMEGPLQLESRGLGLYNAHKQKKALAHMDDGTLVIWDVANNSQQQNQRGTIVARSRSRLLSAESLSGHTPSPRASIASTGAVESIRVDSFRDKVHIAVHNTLAEVDLNTLQVSAAESYPFSISAISAADDRLPTTVGTTLSLHLHDHRQAHNHRSAECSTTRTDAVANFPASPRQQNDFSRLLSGDDVSGFASLFQPGPLNIHHLTDSAQESCEIFVAGRFPSILVYDRRTFPRLRTNFHSGARLCSLSSLPFSFRSLESDLMRKQQLSLREVEETKNIAGDRLIACGEYNGKGSLEIYGLSADRSSTNFPSSQTAGVSQTSTLKNRVSASRSKLLSVVPHGTKLLVSDSDGNLRWFERNGIELVRAWNINSLALTESKSLFSVSFAPTTGGVARKLIPLTLPQAGSNVEHDEVLIWTGDRIAVLGFVSSPRFGGLDGQQWHAESVEDQLQHREERIYGETMHRALQRQADEVRMMQGLGIGQRIR